MTDKIAGASYPAQPILPRARLSYLALVSLTVLFGLEMLRLLVSGLTWTIGDRFGLGAAQLGALALVVFALSFLAGGLQKLAGIQRAMPVAAMATGLCRLFIQFWPGEILISVATAMLGTAAFSLFLTLSLCRAQSGGGRDLSGFVTGLGLGMLLDTAIHGAYLSFDILWQQNVLSLLLAAVLFLALFLALRDVWREKTDQADAKPVGIKLFAWLAIGPFLFLHLVVFQNIARLASFSGLSFPLAYGVIITADIAALALCLFIMHRHGFSPLIISVIASLVLIAAALFPEAQSWHAVLLRVGGILALNSLLTLVIMSTICSGRLRPLSVLNLAGGAGMLLFVILLLGYYAVYQIVLPYSNAQITMFAALLVIISAVAAASGVRQMSSWFFIPWRIPLAACLVLILPLGQLIVWSTPAAVPGTGQPVRVMCYNLHNGFDASGKLDMEALASVIENVNPDILVLQEVSRGWLVNGRVDMISWLSVRLDMPYVFGPTADPLWGNAVFSRYPITSVAHYDLEPRNLFLLRGFTQVSIDLGESDLNVIATHFHHVDDGSDVRINQAEQLLDFWAGQPDTIIAGDFNARPGSVEMQMMLAAGLTDSLSGRDDASVYTYHSAHPYQRIDYIWVSPDIQVLDSEVIFTTASDHHPVVAVISGQ